MKTVIPEIGNFYLESVELFESGFSSVGKLVHYFFRYIFFLFSFNGPNYKYVRLFEIVSELTAAAAAKSLQLCPTLCDPIDGSPPDSPIPGILQARTLEWVAIAFSSA